MPRPSADEVLAQAKRGARATAEDDQKRFDQHLQGNSAVKRSFGQAVAAGKDAALPQSTAEAAADLVYRTATLPVEFTSALFGQESAEANRVIKHAQLKGGPVTDIHSLPYEWLHLNPQAATELWNMGAISTDAYRTIRRGET